LPAGAVSITRPGKFGNPFTEAGCLDAGFQGTDDEIRARCVGAFAAWLGPNWRINWCGAESERRRQAILDALPTLAGKDLACFCPEGQPCHGDVLLRLANGGTDGA
jgi:hypothetical protein